MKKTFCFLLLIFLAFGLFAGDEAEKPIISVLDFSTEEGISKGEMRLFISLLSSSLFKTGLYTVIDISERDALLEELEFSVSGCSDESCQLEIGRLLAAEGIITGRIGKLGSKFALSVKMLQTDTGRAISTADGVYNSIDDMVEDVDTIAYDLAAIHRKDTEESTPMPTKDPVAEPTPEVADATPDPGTDPTPDPKEPGKKPLMSLKLNYVYNIPIATIDDQPFLAQSILGANFFAGYTFFSLNTIDIRLLLGIDYTMHSQASELVIEHTLSLISALAGAGVSIDFTKAISMYLGGAGAYVISIHDSPLLNGTQISYDPGAFGILECRYRITRNIDVGLKSSLLAIFYLSEVVLDIKAGIGVGVYF